MIFLGVHFNLSIDTRGAATKKGGVQKAAEAEQPKRTKANRKAKKKGAERARSHSERAGVQRVTKAKKEKKGKAESEVKERKANSASPVQA